MYHDITKKRALNAGGPLLVQMTSTVISRLNLTFGLGDDELHLVGATLYNFCCFTEGQSLQTGLIQ